MTKKYKAYLKSTKWKKISFSVKKRDNFRCVLCGSKKKLQTHHTKYDNIYNEREHSEDLITVCDFCHKYKCHRDKTILKNIDKMEFFVYVLLWVSLATGEIFIRHN